MIQIRVMGIQVRMGIHVRVMVRVMGIQVRVMGILVRVRGYKSKWRNTAPGGGI